MKVQKWVLLGLGWILLFHFSCEKRELTSFPNNEGSISLPVTWQVVEVNGKSVDQQVNGNVPYLEMTDQGVYHANVGCNQMQGTYNRPRGGHLLFSIPAATKMACGDMTLESAFMQILPLIQSYSGSVGELDCKNTQGSVILKLRILAK